MKVLFILKRREDYNYKQHSTSLGLSTGLFNSANFIVNYLNSVNIPTDIEVVIDNNDIDRLVTKHKPTHVIIESLWVVPTKFAQLIPLHPNVKWIIRLHSDIPFIANESVAMDWIIDYLTYNNVYIACNSLRMQRDLDQYILSATGNKKRTIHLPNIYPLDFKFPPRVKDKEFIDVGCFGAIRPLKNHLAQALAAIQYADARKKKLRFHVNSGRIEMKGESVMNNIISVFAHVHKKGHELHNHKWLDHREFLILCGTMDVGMQVSLSETFNIVAADLISQRTPIVTSKEVPWASSWFTADPTDVNDIYKTLYRTMIFKNLNIKSNQSNLREYSENSMDEWDYYFRGQL